MNYLGTTMMRFLFALVSAGGMLLSSQAVAEVVVAEDFFYSQPTKALGVAGGFTGQVYGGGQHGPAGQWTGRWESDGDALITGTDISADQGFDASLDTHQGFARNWLGSHHLQREYEFQGLSDTQTIYFGTKIRNDVVGDTPSARMMINDPLGGTEISIGFGQGGFTGTLGSSTNVVPGPGLTDDGQYHQLIGRLEVNAVGSDERLTVWLDPTGVETAARRVQVQGDVIAGLGAMDGMLRLDRVDDVASDVSQATGVFWDDVAIGTAWQDVAAVSVPRMTLRVDSVTGATRLSNSSGSDFDVDFYQVESPGRSLLANQWNSLADQGVQGWMENSPDLRVRITESNFTGSTVLPSGSEWNLGEPYNSNGQPDLVAHVGTVDGLLNVAPVRYEEFPESSGDFNGDGQLTVADMDLLCSEVSGAGNTSGFDLTGDGAVDRDDVSAMLGLANRLPGDADFDGQVQFSDFIAMTDNFGQSGRTWSHGDFDCDGEVQFSDFITVTDNFGQSAVGVSASASVPEPVSEWMAVMGLAGLAVARRRHHQRLSWNF